MSDKFRIASGSTRPTVTTLALAMANGATSAELTNASGWDTTTDCDVVIYRRQLNTTTGKYEKVDGSQCEYVASLTGTTLSSMVLRAGTEPSTGYEADGNTVVFCGATAAWADDLVTNLLEQHSQTGTHTAITSTSIANAGNYSQSAGSFTVPTGAIQPAALATAIPASKLANPYKFSARRTIAANSPNNATATVVYDTVDFDTGTNYSNSTGKFTAPADGYYLFRASVLLSSPANRLFLTWSKNGTAYSRATDAQATGNYGTADSLFLHLTATDTMEISLYTDAAKAIDVTVNNTQFSGFLVSAT